MNRDSGLIPSGLEIIAQDSFDLIRTAGSDTAVKLVPTPSGANIILAGFYLLNVSPQLQYDFNYYSFTVEGTLAWSARKSYDSSVGLVKFINSASDAGVIAQTYSMRVTYFICRQTFS